MTYHGVVLLMAGYQADEAHIIKQYEAIVEKSVLLSLSFYFHTQDNFKPTQPLSRWRPLDSKQGMY